MMYRVLRRKLHKTGQTFETANGPQEYYRPTWHEVGRATSMEHAKEQGFVAPVLEPIYAEAQEVIGRAMERQGVVA